MDIHLQLPEFLMTFTGSCTGYSDRHSASSQPLFAAFLTGAGKLKTALPRIPATRIPCVSWGLCQMHLHKIEGRSEGKACVYEFQMAAVTNCHNFTGLK